MYRRKDYIGFHIICTALATAAVALVAGIALFGIKCLLSLFALTEASFFMGVVGGAISLCSTIFVSALGIAAITGLYLYHCSRNKSISIPAQNVLKIKNPYIHVLPWSFILAPHAGTEKSICFLASEKSRKT